MKTSGSDDQQGRTSQHAVVPARPSYSTSSSGRGYLSIYLRTEPSLSSFPRTWVRVHNSLCLLRSLQHGASQLTSFTYRPVVLKKVGE